MQLCAADLRRDRLQQLLLHALQDPADHDDPKALRATADPHRPLPLSTLVAPTAEKGVDRRPGAAANSNRALHHHQMSIGQRHSNGQQKAAGWTPFAPRGLPADEAVLAVAPPAVPTSAKKMLYEAAGGSGVERRRRQQQRCSAATGTRERASKASNAGTSAAPAASSRHDESVALKKNVSSASLSASALGRYLDTKSALAAAAAGQQAVAVSLPALVQHNRAATVGAAAKTTGSAGGLAAMHSPAFLKEGHVPSPLIAGRTYYAGVYWVPSAVQTLDRRLTAMYRAEVAKHSGPHRNDSDEWTW